ncbi:MAG: glycosyltransferase family 4 protein [Pseudomonadota bacterium]
MRLAVLTSHPVQYYAPLFRELTKHVNLHVFFSHNPSAEQQAEAGFGTAFTWDIDLLCGYEHTFLNNVSKAPSTATFSGCDTPEIGRKLSDGKFDVVLSLGWHLKSLLQGTIAARRRGIPVIIRGDSQLRTSRGFAKRATKEAAYPLFLKLFSAAAYVGQHNRDYYRHYKYPEKRLFHSPHCVETERFSLGATSEARAQKRNSLSVSDDTQLVLFAGKLIPFKNPLDTVGAVAKLRQAGRKVELMIAGSGPLEEELIAAAATENVPMHRLGFCNQSEMPGVYAAADILVVPSTARETWGLVANEALASGTPIAVSDEVGCAPDLAADGQAGGIYKMKDIEALSALIDQTLKDPPSLRAIQQKSAEHSIENAARGILEAANWCIR